MLRYHFTSGVHAVAGSSPWDTTRPGVTQDAIPTTRLAIYDVFATALELIGYERFDRKLAGVSPSQATRDDIWFSRGESGKKHVLFRTAIHNHSGAAGTQYFTVLHAPKRNNASAVLSGTWTWNGTTTVTSTNTSQVRIGSYIKLTSDGQWFKVTAIVVNTSVTIDNTAGWVIPSGATGSSVLAPDLEADIGNAALTGTTAPFNVDTYRLDLGASDFSADFQLVGDKDWVWFVFQNVNHTATMFVIGVGDVIPLDVNPNVMHLASNVSAGDFVELLTVDENGATVNPIVLGYRVMDRIQIVEVDHQTTPKAETQVIVRVQTDRITVRRLRFSYTGRNFTVNPERIGARIGMTPCPIGMHLSANVEIEQPTLGNNHFRTPFFQDLLVDAVDPQVPGRTQGDLVSVPTTKQGQNLYFLHFAQHTTHAQLNDEYGTGTSPNDRTLRFTMRGLAFGHYNSPPTYIPGNTLLGKVPRLATYNGSVVYYPHDNFQQDRPNPDRDYVPMRFTATSSSNYALGPVPGP
jgi:hypothetical protein